MRIGRKILLRVFLLMQTLLSVFVMLTYIYKDKKETTTTNVLSKKLEIKVEIQVHDVYEQALFIVKREGRCEDNNNDDDDDDDEDDEDEDHDMKAADIRSFDDFTKFSTQ